MPFLVKITYFAIFWKILHILPLLRKNHNSRQESECQREERETERQGERKRKQRKSTQTQGNQFEIQSPPQSMAVDNCSPKREMKGRRVQKCHSL